MICSASFIVRGLLAAHAVIHLESNDDFAVATEGALRRRLGPCSWGGGSAHGPLVWRSCCLLTLCLQATARTGDGSSESVPPLRQSVAQASWLFHPIALVG